MIPEGDYDGTILGRFAFLNRIWTGKRFVGNTVSNWIGGRLLVEGTVSEIGFGGRVLITYPGGLKDVLWPTPTGWAGSMALGPFQVRFTLTKRKGL